MSTFGVILGDLNDYLTPSQACVVAVSAPSPATTVGEGGALSIGLSYDPEPPPRAPPRARAGIIKESPLSYDSSTSTSTPPPTVARITLSDCLACSGCVTSAETVLMEQQSSGELRRLVGDPGVAGVVVLLSPQALHALAMHMGVGSALEAYARLCAFFKDRLGCKAVVDTAVGLHVSLAEVGDEVMRRVLGGVEPPPWVPPPYSTPASATHYLLPTPAAAGGGGGDGGFSGSAGERAPHPSPHIPAPLPVLASACPGWVCYCEKSAPEALPYLSTARSPQQATGALVKTLWSTWKGGKGGVGGRVATVAIMPCYEKKLEASRRDFTWEGEGGKEEGEGWKEVDCVLVASEVMELMVEEGVGRDCLQGGGLTPHTILPGVLFGGGGVPPSSTLPLPLPTCPWERLERVFRGVSSVAGAGAAGAAGAAGGQVLSLVGATTTHGDSDGYCTYAYRHVERVLKGRGSAAAAAVGGGGGGALPVIDLHSPIPFVAGRNADFKEATLATSPDASTPPLTFALAYGFRNIQGVISRLKKRGAVGGGGGKYAYIEVMACPKGCTNGGGLGGVPSTTTTSSSPPSPPPKPLSQRIHDVEASHDPHAVRAALLGLEPSLERAGWLPLMHTLYHAVPPLTGEAAGLAMANKW